ncbi:hypothetical protein CKAH01_12388 [Colletotrichum kahawae]|uniref:Uncharacterized protein n=1 Tax=Colletotrichum kahawae TaxID=34407 RepID=A0AAD9YTJ1_COLKA|nr:hypothetical protein CKAH01_12388 [Colletotrichum kahawae]
MIALEAQMKTPGADSGAPGDFEPVDTLYGIVLPSLSEMSLALQTNNQASAHHGGRPTPVLARQPDHLRVP